MKASVTEKNSDSVFVEKIVPSFFRGMGQALSWVVFGVVVFLMVKVF